MVGTNLFAGLLIGLLFAFIGLLLDNKAIKLSRERYRFGVIELVMDSFPGSIGGNVGGSFEITKSAAHGQKYKLNWNASTRINQRQTPSN